MSPAYFQEVSRKGREEKEKKRKGKKAQSQVSPAEIRESRYRKQFHFICFLLKSRK